MLPPIIGGGIKRCFCLTSDICLTSVCLSVCLTDVCLFAAYIGPKSRTERGLGRPKTGIEIAHLTRDLNTTFKVKKSKVKVTRPLYSARP